MNAVCKILCCLGLANLVWGYTHYVPAPESFDCANADPTGLIEYNCWGYAECVNNIVIVHPCPNGTEFDRASFTCVPEGTPGNDCHRDESTNCAQQPDGFYPDIDIKCISYYRCYAGAFAGRFFCPSSLVFNTALDSCDYPGQVSPPCGTLGVRK